MFVFCFFVHLCLPFESKSWLTASFLFSCLDSETLEPTLTSTFSYSLSFINWGVFWTLLTSEERGIILHYLMWPAYTWNKGSDGHSSLETIYHSSPTGYRNSYTFMCRINPPSSQNAQSLIPLWYWFRIYI